MRSDDVWSAIQEDYEKGVPLLHLEARHGVTRTGIRKRAAREGWLKPAPAQVDHAYVDVFRVRFQEQTKYSSGEPASSLNLRAEIIHLHRLEWRDVDKLRKVAMKAALDHKYVPADLTDEEKTKWSSTKRMALARQYMALYRAAVEAMMTKQEGERRAHGFDYKIQQEQARSPEDRSKAVEFTREWRANMDALARKFGIDGGTAQSTNPLS